METNEEKFDAFLNEARDYISEQITGALSGLFAAKQEPPKSNNGGPRPPESQNTPPAPGENSNSGTGGNGSGGSSGGGEKNSGASRRWFGDRA